MLDLSTLAILLVLMGVVGYALGTGRFTKSNSQPATSTISTLAALAPHLPPSSHTPSLSLQPATNNNNTNTETFTTNTTISSVTTPTISDTATNASLTVIPARVRHVLIVAKHLPIKVIVGSNPDEEWRVDWEDSRSFLANLRFLDSDKLIIHWIGLAQQSFLSPSITDDQKQHYRDIAAQHNCVPVFLPPVIHDRFLNGFCKNILWPMLHYVMPVPADNFGETWPDVWSAYSIANEIIAQEVCNLIKRDDGRTDSYDSIWIHNYHLFLTPSFIRRKYPHTKIGLFIHTPFPSSDIFRALPTRAALLDSIMCCDLLGFHTFDYARHFLSCVKRVLDLDFETLPGGALGIKYSGRFVSILISHVGIASNVIRTVSQSSAVLARVKELRAKFPNRKILIGVDDLDAVKGPLLKIQAIDRFLSKYRDQVDKVVFVGILLLSKNYSDTLGIRRDLLAEISRVQSVFHKDVIHVIEPVDYMPVTEQVAWYRAAHVALVSTFWDGLNLMPYEYTASQDVNDPGSLIISEFMGCSRSLNGVIRVNPWSLENVADAIQESLTMSLEERKANHQRRYRYVMNHTTERWANGFIDQLDRASSLAASLHFVTVGEGPESKLLGLRPDFVHLEESKLIESYQRCDKRIIFLDYDGTLVTSDKQNGTKKVAGHPPPSIIRLLTRLCEDENNCVFLMSGRTRSTLMEWFGEVQELGLAAEKGLFLRWPKRLEKSCRMTWGETLEEEEEDEEEPIGRIDDSDESQEDQPKGPLLRAATMRPSPQSSPSHSSQKHPPSSNHNKKRVAIDFTPHVKSSSLADAEWEHMVSLHDVSWKSLALDAIRAYTEQTDGSWIEDKEFAIMWHYEGADADYGKMQATDLHKFLTKVLANPSIDVVKYEYSRILEVKPHGISKGNAATAICEALLNGREKEKNFASIMTQLPIYRTTSAPVFNPPIITAAVPALPPPPFQGSKAVFFLAIGDDRSDEDMFIAVQHKQYLEEKIRIGRLKEQGGIRRSHTVAVANANLTGGEEKESTGSTDNTTTKRLSGVAAPAIPAAASQVSGVASGEYSDPDVFTICVGQKPSAAHYYLEDDKTVVKVLNNLAQLTHHNHTQQRPSSPVIVDAEEGLRNRKKRHSATKSLGGL